MIDTVLQRHEPFTLVISLEVIATLPHLILVITANAPLSLVVSKTIHSYLCIQQKAPLYIGGQFKHPSLHWWSVDKCPNTLMVSREVLNDTSNQHNVPFTCIVSRGVPPLGLWLRSAGPADSESIR